MCLILNIESSSTNCSVSIGDDEKCLIYKEVNSGFSHSENLLLFINEILDVSSVSIKDIDAVAVSAGPGSYTGLRIGVSAAKGLCFGLDIPLIAIESLSIIAKNILSNFNLKEQDLLIPLFDARRMEVYTAVLNSSLQIVEPVSAKIIDEQTFSNLTSGHTIYYFGDGANKCQPFFKDKPNFKLIENIVPSAKDMVELSFQKYHNKSFENVAYFEPFYLKDFHTNAKIV